MSVNEPKAVQVQLRADRINSLALDDSMRNLFMTMVLFSVCGLVLFVVHLWSGLKEAKDALSLLFAALFCIQGVANLFGGLKTSLFSLQIIRDSSSEPLLFIFAGAGWGHGVGMCQNGAIGMAEHGYDYREILRHYYNGAEVKKVFNY